MLPSPEAIHLRASHSLLSDGVVEVKGRRLVEGEEILPIVRTLGLVDG